MIEHLQILLFQFQHFYRNSFLKIDPNMDIDVNVNSKTKTSQGFPNAPSIALAKTEVTCEPRKKMETSCRVFWGVIHLRMRHNLRDDFSDVRRFEALRLPGTQNTKPTKVLGTFGVAWIFFPGSRKAPKF